MSDLTNEVVEFLSKAATDYHHPNNVDIQIISPQLEHYDRLNIKLSKKPLDNQDIISLITNLNEGMNGWLDINNDHDQNRYKFFGLEKPEDRKTTSIGIYSGKIAFRKELLENAIEGGYIKNIEIKNLFKDLALLPGVVKSVLENAPLDILSLGRKNLIAKIDELKRTQFLTEEEHSQWIQEFKKSLKGYPEYKEKPEGTLNILMDKVSSLRDNLFSNKKDSKLEI